MAGQMKGIKFELVIRMRVPNYSKRKTLKEASHI
jgi:hypothetical protein